MKYIYFGSSFVNIFTLVKNDDMFVKKFRAKSAKGISKKGDDDGETIRHMVKKYKNEIECLVFNFGSVDVNFSYFYLLEKNDYEIKYKSVFKKIAKYYVKFVNNIDLENSKKTIICPYYSPIEDKYVLTSLQSYGVVSENVDFQKMKKYLRRRRRNKVVDYFNSKLKHYANKYNITTIDINKDISENGIIKDKYIDISKLNIHLVYEELIKNYVDKMNKCGVHEDMIDFTQYDEYLKKKKEELKDIAPPKEYDPK
jgi:hypothetical protein